MALFLAFITLLIKLIFIDNYCNTILRERHSKSYIKKHYNGLMNTIFYSKLFKEISFPIIIMNYLSIILILFLILLSSISIITSINIHSILNYLINIYIVLMFLLFIYDSIKIIFLNKDSKNNKLNIIQRIIYAFIFSIIICLIFFMID